MHFVLPPNVAILQTHLRTVPFTPLPYTAHAARPDTGMACTPQVPERAP